MLTPVVRQILESDTATPSGWRCESVLGSIGVGTFIYRVSGEANDGSERVQWSTIVKVLIEQPGETDPDGWFYWRREANFYASSLPDEIDLK